MRGVQLFLAVVAALLVSGAVSAMPASAIELIKFTKTGRFEGKSTGTVLFEFANGDQFDCSSMSLKGTVETETKGKTLALLEKCVASPLGNCTSAGAPEGEIHIPDLLVLLGSDSGTEMNPAMLFKPSNPSTGAEEPIVFNCGLTTFTIKGSMICLVKNAANGEEMEILCEKGGKVGEQRDKFFWDSTQSGTENAFKSSATGGIIQFSELETCLIFGAHLKGTEGQVIQIEV